MVFLRRQSSIECLLPRSNDTLQSNKSISLIACSLVVCFDNNDLVAEALACACSFVSPRNSFDLDALRKQQ